MKLEAIVLAAGPGSRMVELTRARAKCLLPVANHCLIWFAITNLRLAGVTRIIILVPDNHESDIKQYCHKKFNSFKDLSLEFASVPTKADCGTAESILSIKDKIRGDFIVHSCDSIVEPEALKALVNHYRLYDPMLSMLLVDNPNHFQLRGVPGRRDKERYMRDVIAIEPLDKLNLTAGSKFSANEIIFISAERDLKQKLKFKNKTLALHPAFEVFSQFLDTHIYIFKYELLESMSQWTELAILKGEVIPLLVSKQFSKMNQKLSQDDPEERVEDGMKRKTSHMDHEIELREKLESFNPCHATRMDYYQKAPVPIPSACHALIGKDITAHRVNTIGTYLDSNRESRAILNSFGIKNTTVVKDCVIGESTVIGEKCTLKKGSIGNNCKIGDKVKIFDCVVMDNVDIESNTTLSECIVGSGAKIGSKCDLKSCIIGYRQVVHGGRKANHEVVIDDGYAIDLSDPVMAIVE